jgi:Tfp pilus assembly protein PilX
LLREIRRKMMKLNRIINQKGIALIAAILMLVVLSVLGIIAVNVTTIGAKITGNTRTSKQAFYLAEAGVERARELLRTRLMVSGVKLSDELNSVKGVDGVLVDSAVVSNFSTADDIPYINSTTLGNGSFKVYLTNDAAEGVTSTTDTNGRVTLTSFGNGPDNSQAIIQVTVLKAGGVPALPGAITMPGPNAAFNAGSSNVSTYSGDATHPAIAVNSGTSQTSIITGIQGPPDRSSKYTGMGITPSVVNMTIPDPWGNLTKLQSLYQNLQGMADFTSSTAPGFTLGNTSNPKVVVIDGDYTMGGGSSGAGILLVTGTLTLNGNINYDGMVLVMGKGSIIRNGGGCGVISGGIFIANIAGPDGNINTTDDNAWGTPSWTTNGGGTSDVDYVFASENDALEMIPFIRLSWKQLYR